MILYFGESNQDLGIFAYRTIGQISNAAGSCIDFVSAIHTVPEGSQAPAVVIANCGQLIWYRRGGRAVTQQTWNALPRKTGVSLPYKLDPEKNYVKGHKTVGEHVESVFEWVRKEADEGVRVDIVVVGDSIGGVVRYLETRWGEWKTKVEAVAVGRLVFSAFSWLLPYMKNAYADIINSGHAWLGADRSEWSDEFADFWARVSRPPFLSSPQQNPRPFAQDQANRKQRARAYIISQEPLDTPLTGRDEFGCNCYASGETTYVERTMPMAYKSILTYVS